MKKSYLFQRQASSTPHWLFQSKRGGVSLLRARISLLCQGDSEFEHYVLVMKIILSLFMNGMGYL